ncbi:MAG: FAD-dependent oxidoreductase, partial [Candidatus Omnitrophica bacterium]|nr:FAD-dependent oxidoreductase [Candidatus Omnitrophota bacterium]
LVASFGALPSAQSDADLLVVGGTEGGCAAAIQAARMGIPNIVLVNDIEWLGGQFSAEALCAVDENSNTTGLAPGVRHQVPIPRSGLFKETVDRIHRLNEKKYGHPRPGNTRVNTTVCPADGNQVFHEMIQPYVDTGQIEILSHYYPIEVTHSPDGTTVTGVRFRSTEDPSQEVTIEARLTIDATEWGEVIKLSGAAYEFGPDLKSKYGEPEAPESREAYPITDMNPVTYTMVIVETSEEHAIPKPAGYDPRVYDTSPYPRDHDYFYTSRRVIDHYNLEGVHHPDVILLCTPIQDYPFDVLPKQVAEALEAIEPGASKKNIVEMTREQRQIIFENAKLQSLGSLYWLQTELHDRLEDKTHSFRRFRLTDEFGTKDCLPWKPYVRESLRLKAMYMMKQQDTLGVEGESQNFAKVMHHDGVACWQFEYDFHPTRREFLDDDALGPWQPKFRKLRNWGAPYSGRANFPIRSLIPETTDGLLAAEKNLGYSSIVSSAIRLHDHCMAVGQACGAVAAVALKNRVQPRAIPYDLKKIEEVRAGLCHGGPEVEPVVLWPFKDVEPSHPAFVAINRLAARQAIPIQPTEYEFKPDETAASEWKDRVIAQTRSTVQTQESLSPPKGEMTRGEFIRALWERVENLPLKQPEMGPAPDRDYDGVPDLEDPLPLDQDNDNLFDWIKTE